MNFDTVLERTLTGYAKQHEIIGLRTMLGRIEERVKALEDVALTFDKEVYTLKDLEPVMCLKPDTIRKKYITTGLIKAWIPEGTKAYRLTQQEFRRVVEIVKQRGNWALGA